MTEFEKLKHRLKNVEKGTTEYRMTVDEARALIKEFEDLEKSTLEKLSLDKPKPIPIEKLPINVRVLDGGDF